MATSIISGQMSWQADRDRDGHRTYKVIHRVTGLKTDGPASVMTTAGLPLIGSLWFFDNDIDVWAFCWPNMKVRPDISSGEGNTTWTVEQTFSTKPLSRCQDTSVTDPLLEPQRISGSTTRFSTNPAEQQTDKDGNLIMAISFEPIEALVWDNDRPQVRIGQNVPTLDLAGITEMINTVNDDVLWGLSARKIKLSDVSWTRQLFGICGYYYTRNFVFDINFDGFDVDWIQAGHKTLVEGGDLENPEDWELSTDKVENPDILPLFIAADGSRATNATKVTKTIQYYKESNFLTLGIPTVIGI